MATYMYGNLDLVKAIRRAGASGFREKQAIRFKGGILSPGAYINNRVIPSYPFEWNFVLNAMIAQARELFIEGKVDVIASVATGAIAYGSVIANRLGIPGVIVKKQEKKTHGLGGLIDGDVKVLQGAKVLLVEDMSSTFGSSLKAMKPLVHEGATVDSVLIINTWNLPEFIENSKDHKVYVGCTGEQILDDAVNYCTVGQEHEEIIRNWIKNPEDQSWSETGDWVIPQ